MQRWNASRLSSRFDSGNSPSDRVSLGPRSKWLKSIGTAPCRGEPPPHRNPSFSPTSPTILQTLASRTLFRTSMNPERRRSAPVDGQDRCVDREGIAAGRPSRASLSWSSSLLHPEMIVKGERSGAIILSRTSLVAIEASKTISWDTATESFHLSLTEQGSLPFRVSGIGIGHGGTVPFGTAMNSATPKKSQLAVTALTSLESRMEGRPLVPLPRGMKIPGRGIISGCAAFVYAG